jgi:uncharacterized protein with HEPN domain
MNTEEIQYLEHLLNNLLRAKKTLNYSYTICKKIGIKNEYNEEEKDRLESLSSKFARLTDLILKQVIKTIVKLELEDLPETMRDTINLAEKKGLIPGALKFIEIRKMRNKIAHEYVEEDDLLSIYQFVLVETPLLFDTVDRIEAYCKKFSHPACGA